MATRLVAEDWLFAQPTLSGSVLAVDLFLNTGQHARLDVIPLLDLVSGSPDQFPEIIITAEGTGEDPHAHGSAHRWLARPPPPPLRMEQGGAERTPRLPDQRQAEPVHQQLLQPAGSVSADQV